MSIRHPKFQQGRKSTRIKPAFYVPPAPTKFHRQVDKALGVPETKGLGFEPKPKKKKQRTPEQERLVVAQKAKEMHKRAMKAYRQAHPELVAERAARQQQHKHRHNYKKLLRTNPETGARVMACNCGVYTIVEASAS